MPEYKILIDTNIFISAEDYRELSPELAELLKILEENRHIICIHPASLKDLEKDKLEERRKVMRSKVEKYPLLESPPEPKEEFLNRIGPIRTDNDRVDANLLYAVLQFCADFLITEDREIHKKAKKLGVANKVLTIQSALEMFKKIHRRKIPYYAPFITRKKPYELGLNDPFFLSLKQDYPEFENWWQKISREGRDCWIYSENGKIKALLILKEEEEGIRLVEKSLPPNRRLKICTLKVETSGYKIGELFLKMTFDYCVKNEIPEIYLTHFTKPDDPLVGLLTRFGFKKIGELPRKLRGETRHEDVYLKSLLPINDTTNLDPVEISREYYPSFVDAPRVKKFIVPITPKFHDLLFPEFPGRNQRQLEEFFPSRIGIVGNTIDKWYLSRSKIRQIRSGDLLIFYRSSYKKLTAVGVVHEILQSRNPQRIKMFVKERTVYSDPEIEKMAEGGMVLALKFRFHFHLKPIPLKRLEEQGILKGPPQSIVGIPHEKYLWIKREGNIDERFTFR